MRCYIDQLPPFAVGFKSENEARKLIIDVTAWKAEHPDMWFEIFVELPEQPGVQYPAPVTLDGNELTWLVTDEFTTTVGDGLYEVFGHSGEVLKRTGSQTLSIMGSGLTMESPEAEVPDVSKPWVDQVLAARAEIAAAQKETTEQAEAAAQHAADAQDAADSARGVIEDAVEDMNAASARAEAAADAANKAAANVEDGGYYEPSVSSTGTLTWRPSKEGMPFPDSVSIQGPRGLTGATGGTPTFTISRVENGTSVKISTPSVPNPGMPDTPGTIQFFTIPDGEKGEKGDRGEPGTIPIVAEADGNVISISDSAAFPLQKLTVYGKTTQNGTPTPSAPVPLVTVGADGNVKVSSCGKNLYNPDMTVFGEPFYNTDGTTQSASSVRVGLIPVEPNTAYTATAYGDYYIRMAQLDANKVYIRRNTLLGSEEGASVTITTAANAAYIQVAADRSLSKAQIEKGTVATEYEQDAPKTAIITTPNGLHGVPVTSGGNYTDKNGQQWVADSIEYDAATGKAKYVQRTKQVTFNGSETWNPSGTNASNVYRMLVQLTDIVVPSNASEVAHIMCDRYVTLSANQTYLQTVGVCGQVWGGNAAVAFYDTTYTDASSWKAHLSANPVECQFVLTTPVETELSADQFAVLRNFYPTTVVYNSERAHMEIKYIADTKNYIDKKIEMLAAARLNNV